MSPRKRNTTFQPTPGQLAKIMTLVAKHDLCRADVESLNLYLPPLLKALALGLPLPSLEDFRDFLGLPIPFATFSVDRFADPDIMCKRAGITRVNPIDIYLRDISCAFDRTEGKVKPSLVEIKTSTDMHGALVLLSSRNLRPATLLELLTFSEKNPEEHLKHRLFALGSDNSVALRCTLSIVAEPLIGGNSEPEKVLNLMESNHRLPFYVGNCLLGIEVEN